LSRDNAKADLKIACSEMRRALRDVLNRVRLKKSLGQNFMRSCRLGALFLKHVAPFKPRSVLEVGAGVGLLTFFLALTGAKVLAVELDPRLTALLRKNVSTLPNVFPLEADGLFIVETAAVRADGIASNTPYNISGPLIAAFVKSRMDWAVLTLQEEVALKLAAKPGSRNYGKISALTQIFCKVKICEKISPKEFIPKPDVNSRMVILTRKRSWHPTYADLERFLKCMFSQRRKLAYKVVERCACLIWGSVSRNELRRLRGCGKRVYELSPDEILSIYINSLNTASGTTA